MPSRARKTPLKVVTEATARQAPKKRPMTVLEAAETGTYLDELMAMRRRIAAAVTDPNCPARDLAALTRREIEIAREINALKAADEVDDIGAAAATPDEEWAAT